MANRVSDKILGSTKEGTRQPDILTCLFYFKIFHKSMKQKLGKTQGKICGCLWVFSGTYEYHWTSAKIFSIHCIQCTDITFSMDRVAYIS